MAVPMYAFKGARLVYDHKGEIIAVGKNARGKGYGQALVEANKNKSLQGYTQFGAQLYKDAQQGVNDYHAANGTTRGKNGTKANKKMSLPWPVRLLTFGFRTVQRFLLANGGKDAKTRSEQGRAKMVAQTGYERYKAGRNPQKLLH